MALRCGGVGGSVERRAEGRDESYQRMTQLLWICLGGAIGTGARFLLATWVQKIADGPFPLGTLAVNFIGSFLLAALMHAAISIEGFSPTLRLAMTTGIMGGFTTYSTFSYETMQLLRQEAWGLAAVNVSVTVVTCLVACFLGFAIARAVLGS